MMHPLEIWRAAPRISNGELPCRTLLEQCLEEIQRGDAQFHAWALVDGPGARASADQLDDELRRGRYRGPLHGMPIGVKDIVDVRGLPTRAGSPHSPDTPAVKHARVVQNLVDAGAVIVGKTVTTEWACFDPPATRNPWDGTRSPGGSSSGSAVAVAAGMCVAAVGTQTGGSIIRPAAYCGVCGCKPTFGQDGGMAGIIAVSPHLDHVGPLASSVLDLTYMLDAMAPGRGLLSHFHAAMKTSSAPRLGRLNDFFVDRMEPSVNECVQEAIERLAGDGAAVVDVPLPDCFQDVHTMHRCIMAADVAQTHEHLLAKHADGLGRSFRALLEEGVRVAESDYRRALAHLARCRAEADRWVGHVDVLVTASTPGLPPRADQGTGDPIFNSPWSYNGLPAVSVPCGTSAGGLPIGIQLIGARGRDSHLLSIAAWCEQRLPRVTLPAVRFHEAE